MKEINAIENFSLEHLNSGEVPGISAVYTKDDQVANKNLLSVNTSDHTTVEISADISAKTFIRVLEFLYSGETRICFRKNLKLTVSGSNSS